jgi:hypothetical protein
MVKWLPTYDVSWICTGIVEIGLYVALFYHVMKGNKNKWLLGVTVLLLFSAIASVITGYTLLEMVGVLQVYSGIMLVSSVIKIKRFFAERNATNFINTSMLLRHAIAFGLYMATTVAYFLALCYWGWA